MKSVLIVFLLVVIILVFIFFFRGNEKSGIKNAQINSVQDEKTEENPSGVSYEEEAIKCARELYENAKDFGLEFNSQCLGVCGDYAIDIVHVPRTREDNLVENQCEDFRSGKVHKFIELDRDGNLVRIFND